MPILLRYHRQWEHGAKAEVCTICGKTRMSFEESVIFVSNFAYITHTRQNNSTIPPILTKIKLKKSFHVFLDENKNVDSHGGYLQM